MNLARLGCEIFSARLLLALTVALDRALVADNVLARLALNWVDNYELASRAN